MADNDGYRAVCKDCSFKGNFTTKYKAYKERDEHMKQKPTHLVRVTITESS